MPATRTQIYLKQEQRRKLDALSRRTGAPLAHIIREAVDAYLTDTGADAQVALEDTFNTLPDLELPSRDEWDDGSRPDR